MNEKQMGIPGVDVTPANFLILEAPFLWIAKRFALKRSRRKERERKYRDLPGNEPKGNVYELASLSTEYVGRLLEFLREHSITYEIE